MPPPGNTKSAAAQIRAMSGNTDEDLSEKYKTLKRRYQELEEKPKDSNMEPQRSGEQDTSVQQEREQLLERILDMEKQRQAIPMTSTPSSSTGTPAPPTAPEARSTTSPKAVSHESAEKEERNVRRRLNDDGPSEATVNGASEPSRPSPDRATSPSASGLKRPRADSNAESSSNSAGEATSSENVSTSPSNSPTMSKRRRKSSNVELVIASPPRETRSRRKAASLSTASNEDTSTAASKDKPTGNGATDSSGSQSVEASSSSPQPTIPADAQPGLSIDTNPPATSESKSLSNEKRPDASSDSKSPPSTSATDANIDPSLTDQQTSTSKPSNSSSSSTSTSSSSKSTNPYLNLFFPKTNPNGTPTPTSAHPMAFANPYMFYPITPVTPNTPGVYYTNPYMYMGAHMVPGYPPPPGSATSPATPNSSTHPRPPAQPAPVPGPSTEVQAPPAPKPKRTKAHAVTSKSYSIPLVPRDKNGKPMLPLNVGIMTVINLGTVCTREHFHTERYIFPVGYEVTRRYLSTVNPNIEVVYHCTILDGGDGPKFQIVPSDTPDKPVIAGTATGAWSSIVKQANAIRNRQHSNSVSGPDFFGLGQNTIKHLIQQLPNADKLKNYVWQIFIEGGPLGGRHASVIPALPEEYDASTPRGPVYHTPLEREKMKAVVGSASPGDLPKGLSHYPQHIIAQARMQHQVAGPSTAPLQTHGGHSGHSTPTPQPPAQVPLQEQAPQQQPSAVNSNPEQHSQSPPAAPPEAQPHPVTAPPPVAALPQGHPATFIPNTGLAAQAPTPITPNTPAPSIASLMNAYRPGTGPS
ncbi:transforming growth factor beta regulator 1 [Coprinopsis cinerea okayama7|uniref:Transforming growth factor beta regulator 1 n=1 Tax=Coprinopsis cinerea (strain Okayama-7 / 130 / ATCC MYA-4618 / FGSC 9003) TaxID=240176 RepID=A8NQF5_COPC7|nr:transforming growth factor beta regulator 1 [Coprinopsis cinerea okayama7\|eukprot:XP_001835545.1 transforming growth factor beta regulator 1 [Coprinopsis cinerea okayama7\